MCDTHYHLDCTDISFQRFRIMSAANKNAYKCDPCRSKLQDVNTKNKSPSSKNSVRLSKTATPTKSTTISPLPSTEEKEILIKEDENVTQRGKYKVNVPTENSFAEFSNEEDDLGSNLSTPVGNTNRSYSEIQQNTTYKIQELTEKLTKLEKKLEIAENEIDNLTLENLNLQKKIAEYELKVSTLSHICKSTPKSKKKKNQKESLASTKLDLSPNKIKIRENKSENETNYTTAPSTPDCQYLMNEKLTSSKNDSMLSPIIPIEATNISISKEIKQKICLLSTQKNTRNIAQKYLQENYDVCHYLMSGHGIKSMLQDVQHKLLNFTKYDYCIILPGGQDFEQTTDYYDLITCIRETLEKIDFTNVIICLPTYRYAKFANLFNWRVELFNNLLCLDNLTHEYAYIIDSNLNLNYDLTTFQKRTGYLNNHGMRIIWRDIDRFIESCEDYSKEMEETLENPDRVTENPIQLARKESTQSDFFRS